MELKVVEENGARKLDTTVADENLKEWTDELRVMKKSFLRAQKEQETAEQINNILTLLPDGWRQIDPGKLVAVFFFVDDRERPVAVGEFLPDDIVLCKTLMEYQRAIDRELGPARDITVFHRSNVLHPRYSGLPLAYVKKVKCPGCANYDRQLIVSYSYEESAGHGRPPGLWTKKRMVICGNSIHVLDEEKRKETFLA